MNFFDQDSGNRGKTGFFIAYEPGTNLATKLVEKNFPNRESYQIDLINSTANYAVKGTVVLILQLNFGPLASRMKTTSAYLKLCFHSRRRLDNTN